MRIFTALLVAGAIVGYGSPALNPQNQGSASDEIRHKIEQYAESINQADTTLAAKIWLNSPEVSFIHRFRLFIRSGTRTDSIRSSGYTLITPACR